MAGEYREPMLKQENGFCFIQNGTYEVVSNTETWECIGPLLDFIKAPSEFYKILELGSEGDVDNLLDELTSLSAQIGKMVTKIKKAGGKVALPDVKYYKEKFEKFTEAIENVPYKLAKEKEKAFAKEVASEFRTCMKKCVAHNYNETLDLNKNGAGILIPAEKQTSMAKISTYIKESEKVAPPKRPWNK